MQRLLRLGVFTLVIVLGLLWFAGYQFRGPDLPAAAPQTTTAETEPTSGTPLVSGGLGLTRAQWTALHGQGTADPALGERYNGGYIVYYQPDTTEVDAIGGMEFQWSASAPQTMANARAASKNLIPADSTLVKTYELSGRTVDLYMSTWLRDRFPATMKIKDSDFPIWINGEPGNFIVLYRVTEARVTSIVLGLGNNP